MGCYQAGYSACVRSIPQEKLPFEENEQERLTREAFTAIREALNDIKKRVGE